MQRYFIDNCTDYIKKSNSDEVYYHLKKVLRSKVNEQVEFCDSNGNCYLYSIDEINANEIVFTKQDKLLNNNELPKRIILGLSLLKNNNFELVLQKAVELGVSDIIPLEFNRTVVKASNFSEKKLQRFKKIILEASEQSKRNLVPKLHPVHSVKQLDKVEVTNKFVAYENSSDNKLLVKHLNDVKDDVMIVIGPEGGLDLLELEKLREFGFEDISLGKRILRAETAAISAISFFAMHFENMKDGGYIG